MLKSNLFSKLFSAKPSQLNVDKEQDQLFEKGKIYEDIREAYKKSIDATIDIAKTIITLSLALIGYLIANLDKFADGKPERGALFVIIIAFTTLASSFLFWLRLSELIRTNAESKTVLDYSASVKNIVYGFIFSIIFLILVPITDGLLSEASKNRVNSGLGIVTLVGLLFNFLANRKSESS